jgi:hypothetical protein
MAANQKQTAQICSAENNNRQTVVNARTDKDE